MHDGRQIVQILDEPALRAKVVAALPRELVLADMPDVDAVIRVAKFLRWEVA